MYWLASIIIYVLLIRYLIFRNDKTIKRRVKKKFVFKKEHPVLIEVIPQGTSKKPLICKVNEKIYFKVLGYSDYKKENIAELNGNYISWHKDNLGRFEKLYGIDNIYYTPSVAGERDIWAKFVDSRSKTSVRVRILVEV